MFDQIIHLILAALGLGLLIFVHEWGHYFAAKRCKMSVEVFSIGFGKPIKTWMSDGVRWQIGSLPFGGYVKIRDLDSSDPEFAEKENRPLAKIIVSLAGPAANLILCFLLFSLIWSCGGRFKSFNEVTSTVSYVAPKGRFYEAGLLAGDKIDMLGGHHYEDLSQFFLFQIAGSGDMKVDRFNFRDQKFSSLMMHIPPHNAPLSGSSKSYDLEVYPGQFVIIADNSSAITAGERIVWANGVPIFSGITLSNAFNEQKAFFSILRKGEVIWTRIPLVSLADLRLSHSERAQLEDWAAEESLTTSPLLTVPYLFNHRGEITTTFVYTDLDTSEKVLKYDAKDPYTIPLEIGDRILTANGYSYVSPSKTLAAFQKKEAMVITQNNFIDSTFDFKQAEKAYWSPWQGKEYHELTLARDMGKEELSNLKLYTHLPLKTIESPDHQMTRLGLDVQRKDHMVLYNPTPWKLFGESLAQSGRTIYFLVTGGMSPSMLSGPIGIVKSMHTSFERSWREAIYWIGFISLSLAVFNLLPIPVLDGGMMLFFVYELITRKRVSAKTMQKFIIPSVILLIAFMLYITYSDVLRLF